MAMPDSLEIVPVRHQLDASVRVPGSKSITNRALVLAALGEGATTLRGAAVCEDSARLVEALSMLGFAVQTLEGGGDAQDVRIVGRGGVIPARNAELDAGSAGTTSRFLTALVSLGSGRYVIDGSARMRERPMGDLVNALRQLGPRIVSHDGHLPITLETQGLDGGRACVGGDVSSQFLSALLMVAPYARAPIDIEVRGTLGSTPYVALTLTMMGEFGVSARRSEDGRFQVPAGRYKPIREYIVEPDASAASYMFAAAAIVGGRVRVEGITRRSKQGDVQFLDVLERAGCEVREGPNWTEVSAERQLRGVDVDLRDTPDVAQTLAVVAPFATSPTTIRGITSARRKECDRISATSTELSRLGVRVAAHDDGMTIWPCAELHGAHVRTYEDHRMAMAFALMGLRVPGVAIEKPGCVSKSFPGYFSAIDALRGDHRA